MIFKALTSFYSKPCQLFLWISLTFGTLYAIALPPFMGMDEYNHFSRIVSFSQGNIFDAARVSPSFLKEADAEMKRVQDFFLNHTPYSFEKVSFKADLRSDADTVLFNEYNRAVLYSPAAYLSAIPVVWLANALGLHMNMQLYLARISIFLAATLLIYWTIKIIPIIKWQIFFLALLQDMVFVRSSANADPLTFGYICLYIAFVLNIIYNDKKITGRQSFALALLSMLICFCKMVYIFYPGMFFLIHRHQFSSRKQYVLTFLFVVIIPVLTSILWGLLASHPYHAIPAGGDSSIYRNVNTDEVAQIMFCISHPLQYLQVMLHTFGLYWPMFMAQLTGTIVNSATEYSFSIQSIMNKILFVGLMPALFFLLPSTESSEKTTFSTYNRLLCFFLFFTTLAFICLTFYIGWTSPGGPEIMGLQGRYFIPIMPLLFLALTRRYTTQSDFIYTISSMVLFVMGMLIYNIGMMLSYVYGIHLSV